MQFVTLIITCKNGKDKYHQNIYTIEGLLDVGVFDKAFI